MTTFSLVGTPGTNTSPVLVDGFDATVESNNIAHRLAKGATSPTFRESSLRRGTFRLNYGGGTGGETASRNGELMFAAGDADEERLFDVDDATRPSLDGMRFFVSGAIRRWLDEDTRDVWFLSVEFEEVAP